MDAGHGRKAGIMHPFPRDRSVRDEAPPGRVDPRRVGKHDEMRFNFRDPGLRLGYAPAKSIGLHRARGYRPKLDHILWADADFMAICDEPGDCFGGRLVLGGSGIGDAQEEIGINENASHDRMPG